VSSTPSHGLCNKSLSCLTLYGVEQTTLGIRLLRLILNVSSASSEGLGLNKSMVVHVYLSYLYLCITGLTLGTSGGRVVTMSHCTQQHQELRVIDGCCRRRLASLTCWWWQCRRKECRLRRRSPRSGLLTLAALLPRSLYRLWSCSTAHGGRVL